MIGRPSGLNNFEACLPVLADCHVSSLVHDVVESDLFFLALPPAMKLLSKQLG